MARDRTSGRGVIHLADDLAALLRMAARLLAGITVVVLGLAALFGLLPRNPEGDWIQPAEPVLQVGLLLVAAVGVGVAGRFPAVAAALLALTGAGLGVLAGVEHPPWVGVLVALGLLVPAVLLWVGWQGDQTWFRIGALATVTAVLLAGSWAGAVRVYDGFFGPAHPQSSTPALTGTAIRWAWSGAVTSSGFTVVVEPSAADSVATVSLLVAPLGGAEVAVAEAPVVAGRARLVASNLEPATTYGYRFALDGVVDPVWLGQARTFPDDDATVVIAFASCARTDTNGAVFDAIREAQPDLFVETGDLHYRNIDRNDVGAFERAYDGVLTAPAIAALTRAVPMAYVWDDHDYAGNDADATAVSRPAARQAYEEIVPHYPLVSDVTIGQAFDVGEVRVVLTDGRSARDGSEQTMLGFEQLAWLQGELLAAADRPLVIWVSPSPWIGVATEGADIWAGFAAERRQIARFLADHDIDNLVIVTGDAHMVAIDDGSNSGYAGEPGPPVLAAASLDRPGNTKGGPYSEGMYPGAGQYGLVRVEPVEDGDEVQVTLQGWRWDGTLLAELSFRLPA